MENFNKIVNEVKQERLRQDGKFREQNHSPMEWCAILGEEVGEVNNAVLETYFNFLGRKNPNDYSDYRKELIQVAAVAIAAIESYDRNNKLKKIQNL